MMLHFIFFMINFVSIVFINEGIYAENDTLFDIKWQNLRFVCDSLEQVLKYDRSFTLH